MNQRHYVQGRRGQRGPALVTAGIVLLALSGGALLLHASGAINLPFLRGEEPPPPPPPFDTTGKIEVPINVRPIKAYSAVTKGDLLNPVTQRIASVWMRPEQVPGDAVLSVAEIQGRVLNHDKPREEVFMKWEFYPPGTHAGPTAGIPPGKRAMRLPATALPGLHGLQQGDKFDIVMTVEVEVEEPRPHAGGSDLPVEGPYASVLDAQVQAERDMPRVKRRRAEVRRVVTNGIVIQPVHDRAALEAPARPAVPGVPPARPKPIEELVIAVDPPEVAALTQSLAIKAQLQVAMRSGRGGEESVATQEEIPDISLEFEKAEPAPGTETGPVRLVEVITGGKKRILAVPAGPLPAKGE